MWGEGALEVTRVLAVTGAKGGTGKTTTAVNLSAAFAALGHRVELRDLDPQASATRALGQPPEADPVTARPLPLRHQLLPSGMLLLRPAGRSLIQVEQGVRTPGDLVKPHWGWNADLLILDCPPALGALTMSALAVAHVALVPVEATPLAFFGLRDLKEALAEIEGRPKLRAVLTRLQRRRNLTGDMRSRLEAEFPGVLCESEIPEDVRAAEAPGAELPITLHAPGAPSSRAYVELASEVEKLLKL